MASAAHRGRQINFGDPQLAGRYWGWRAYQQSKLANILFTRELAGRLEDRSISVNCLHPGFVASRFGDENYAGLRRQIWLMIKMIFAVSEEKGADTIVYLATESGRCRQDGRLLLSPETGTDVGGVP